MATRTANDIKCPHCGSTRGDPYEIGNGEDGAFTVTCDDCRSDFKVERTTEVWFTTLLLEKRTRRVR